MKKNYNHCLVVGVVLGLFIGVAYVQAADTPSLTGSWELLAKYTIRTNSGEATVHFELQHEGQKITGTFFGPRGSSKVTGEILGNDFKLSFNPGGTMDITYRGKVEGNKLSGLIEYGSSGSDGKGTFTGDRKTFEQQWSTEQKEILKMEVAHWDFLKAGDLKGYMELMHKDVMAWPSSEPKPVGREGIEKGTITWYKFVRSYDLKPQAIIIFDKFAVIYYRISWTAPDNRTFPARVGHIWMKQDGKWQMIGGLSSSE